VEAGRASRCSSTDSQGKRGKYEWENRRIVVGKREEWVESRRN